MISKIINSVYNYHKTFALVLLVLFMGSLGAIISDLKVDNTLKVWFSEEDPTYKSYIEFQEDYGNDDIITLLISYPVSVYEPRAVEDMLKLEQAMARLEYVDQVYSYGSSEYLDETDEEFLVEKIVTAVPEDELQIREIRKRVRSIPVIANTLLTPDERSHLILIRLAAFEQIEVHRDEIVRDIRQQIDQVVKGYHLGGLAVLNEALNTTVAKESSLFTGLSYLFLIVILGLVVRKKRFLLIALAAILLPTVFTLGLFAVTGYSLNMISMTLPTILMVYALANAIHIMNRYVYFSDHTRGQTKLDLIVKTMVYCFKPCFFASLTTMLAYLSFYFSPAQVLQSTGLFAFLGIGIAFLTVYIVTIIGFAWLHHPSRESEWSTAGIMKSLTSRFNDWLIVQTKHSQPGILATFIGLLTLSLILIPKVEVNTYPGKYLGPKNHVRQDSEYMEEKMGGYIPFETIIRSNSEEPITTRHHLLVLEEFQRQLQDSSLITHPTSLVEVVKYLNQQIGEGTYQIPASDATISQLLMLYEMDENNRLNELTNIGYTEARLTGRVKLLSAKDYAWILEKEKELFAQVFPSGSLEIIPQGYMPLYIRMIDQTTRSLLYSFLGAFLMVGIVMLLFLRKVKITLISLAVNLIPIAGVALFMSAFSIPLDMGTVMIAAIMLGIGVDDTMHLVHSYLVNRKKDMEVAESIDSALKATSPALMISSLALITGFVIIGMSSVESLHNFGNLCALTVAITLIADLMLLPSVVKGLARVKIFSQTLKPEKNENARIDLTGYDIGGSYHQG